MHVSYLSIFFMFVSVVLSIGAPLFFFLFLRKRYDAMLPMLLGVAGFVVFALVLESSIHRIVFSKFALMETPALYIVYGIFMAGIFEETARFIAFKILKRKYSKQRTEDSKHLPMLAYDGVVTGLSYGIGHGGIESILLAGVPMIFAIIASAIINTINIDFITGKLHGEMLTIISGQLNALSTTAPHMFLVSGIERLMAISIQLSLSVIVFYSVFVTNQAWLFPLAIVLHAIVDIPAAAFQAGVLKSVALVEGITFLLAIALVIFVKFLHKKN